VEVPKVPQWLTVAVVFFLMAVVAYSVYNGYTIEFWPPRITAAAPQSVQGPAGPSSPSTPTSPPPPSAAPTTEWEYKVVDNLAGRSNWRQDLEQLVNALKPRREEIFVAFSGGNDIHIWLAPGGGPNWRVRSVDARSDSRWMDLVSELARDNRVVLIGFGALPETSGGANTLWYLQADAR
jgi:hypothetical protein